MKRTRQIPPLKFFSKLRWLDGKPLVIEPYRQKIFSDVLHTFDEAGRLFYNLALLLRGKKNAKSLDLILAGFYFLLCRKSLGGSTCLVVAFDEGQADQDLDLAKKFVRINPALREAVTIKKTRIERRDGDGVMEIRPGRDILGQHGGKFDFLGIDELHTQKDYNLLEALAADPTRECLQWITSYNSIFHKAGVPLHDFTQQGWRGEDKQMYFSYYSGDKSTDPYFQADHLTPEQRANPSMATWTNKKYLEQEKRRLPSHKYRRLHLNLPGLPEGSAFSVEKIEDAIERGAKVRLPQPDIEYVAFVDMSGGSNDDAVLAVAHQDAEGKAILDRVVDQGQRPPFDPRKAVERFASVLKEYRVFSVTGDKYAGETFVSDFESHGIGYHVSELTKSQIYEALEPKLNSSTVVLLDEPKMESQLLGLIWRGGKIDHPGGEHDDHANAAAGVVNLASGPMITADDIWSGGERTVSRSADWDNEAGYEHPMDRLIGESRRNRLWDI